jgi:hypothetical protein
VNAVQTTIHAGNRITLLMGGVLLDPNAEIMVTVGDVTVVPADTHTTTAAMGAVTDVNGGPRLHLVVPPSLHPGPTQVKVSTGVKSACASITIQ